MRARLLSVAILSACVGGKGATTMPRKGIEAAALPFHVLDRTGHELDEKTFWDQLAGQRAVCVGEEHNNPHHHWMQLNIVQHLAPRWPVFALGMEMVQRPFQGVLDDFAAHKIDDDAMRSRVGWEDRWGYDYGFYGPTIHAALAAHAQLLALNAAKELTKKVVHHGLDSLTADEKAQVPQLDLDDKAHRAWFDALMEDMGGSEAHTHAPAPTDPKPSPQHGDGDGSGSAAATDAEPEMPSADRIYMVQVIWDETMADTAAKWLEAHADGHLVILAGGGHCHDSAIVNRIKRRGVAQVVSVRSVIDDKEGSVAEALAKPITDYTVVLEMPPGIERAPAGSAAE